MQIGMFYQIQVPKPWNESSEIDRYHNMLDQVSFGDEIGMSSVWFVEHHFRSEWSHSSAPDVTLAAISQRTKNIRLGIGVVLSPIHHPLHTASRIATLDILSKGRADMGVGRSGYPFQMEAFGIDLKDATGIVEESLKIIPGAWEPGEFSYDGEYFKIPLREVVPKPYQKPHPPLWQACSREETFRKAGEQGLGCIAQAGSATLASSVAAYREAISNPNPVSRVVNNKVAVSTVAFCHEDRDWALERGAQLVDWYRDQQKLRDARVWQGQEDAKVPDDYRWHYDKSVSNVAKSDEPSSLDLIEQGQFCVGTPDDCIRFLENQELAGVDEVLPLYQVGPVEHSEVMNTLKLFGDHVVPHFSKKALAR